MSLRGSVQEVQPENPPHGFQPPTSLSPCSPKGTLAASRVSYHHPSPNKETSDCHQAPPPINPSPVEIVTVEPVQLINVSPNDEDMEWNHAESPPSTSSTSHPPADFQAGGEGEEEIDGTPKDCEIMGNQFEPLNLDGNSAEEEHGDDLREGFSKPFNNATQLLDFDTLTNAIENDERVMDKVTTAEGQSMSGERENPSSTVDEAVDQHAKKRYESGGCYTKFCKLKLTKVKKNLFNFS